MRSVVLSMSFVRLSVRPPKTCKVPCTVMDFPMPVLPMVHTLLPVFFYIPISMLMLQ